MLGLGNKAAGVSHSPWFYLVMGIFTSAAPKARTNENADIYIEHENRHTDSWLKTDHLLNVTSSPVVQTSQVPVILHQLKNIEL